jgi:hypothetical protein
MWQRGALPLNNADNSLPLDNVDSAWCKVWLWLVEQEPNLGGTYKTLPWRVNPIAVEGI